MHNAQSFTHRNQTPLTIEETARRAPSALATRAYDAMSAKYSHIATLGVIEAMIAAGFQPFRAVQSRTRVPGKGEFTKHMLRFRHEDVSQSLTVDEVIPEVVLINSHDGGWPRCLAAVRRPQPWSSRAGMRRPIKEQKP